MPHDQVEVVVSLILSTHHNMVNQKSLHFIQSQHKTPKRDALNLLVLFGTRWQGKREGIRSGIWCVCIQSRHTQLHESGEGIQELFWVPCCTQDIMGHSKLIIGFQAGDWRTGIFQNSTRLHSYTQYPLGLFWQMLVTTSSREPLKTY